MIKQMAEELVDISDKLAETCKDGILEAIPESGVSKHDLELLHRFAARNPIYHDSYESRIDGANYTIYKGDINRYWLSSIQHNTSQAPFSPTWIMSAYVCAMYAKELGYSEVIDVGSGDGRIAFCAKVLGMESHSIEIDGMLADLQIHLSSLLDFDPRCADAALFDYSSLRLVRPMFFIGGLAQMGGASLASHIIKNMDSQIMSKSGWAFAGTLAQKYAPDPKNEAGWGTLIKNNGLKKITSVTLPTAWTLHEPDRTPYIFAKPA